MNKKYRLRDLAEILTGYQFRKEQPVSSHGSIKFIQMRDIDKDNRINEKSVINVHLDIDDNQLNTRYLLLQNDIIFKNRGWNNTAAIYNLDWPSAIASHQFIIIRPHYNTVLPEYLLWYINNKAQAYLKSNASGTTTLLIQKKAIEEMEVIVPSIQTQKKIIGIIKLNKRYNELQKRQIELQTIYINKKIDELINKK
jgi:restriction endonuclease S subunit